MATAARTACRAAAGLAGCSRALGTLLATLLRTGLGALPALPPLRRA
jgi:hypothetical protein